MMRLKNVIRITRADNPSLLLEDLRALVQQHDNGYEVTYADLVSTLKADAPPLYVRSGTSGEGGADDAYRITVWYKQGRFIVTRWDVDGVRRIGNYADKDDALKFAQTSGLPRAEDMWPTPEEFFA